ncbi:PLP-dependent transferase [Peniophora sp. CONT]|nr:PLP-dependent transferase [Peniophora sp. CONT]
MPHESVFPFHNVQADILLPDSFPLSSPRESEAASPLSWLWRIFGYDPTKEKTTHVVVPKARSEGDGGMNLATALQYGPATGMAATQKFTASFSELVFKPAFADWKTIVQTGNTDGWSRCARMLCNPGDTIIAEEWTYPSALASAAPIHINVLPIALDGIGIRPDALREALANWDESKGRRPHIMYTVPIGQNPSGATMDIQRKKEIYDICVEYDVIIVEDDPYYFLQMDEYAPKAARTESAQASQDNESFLASLAPSFLAIDTQGRVIRLDTFSKTVAPGVRLGWCTCAPLFAERLERIGETSTQSPCGLGQSLVMRLMQEWTIDGYVRWLRGIRVQYGARRDFFIDTVSEVFSLERRVCTQGVWAGSDVYTAYARPRSSMFMSEKSTRKALFEFVPPSSGMFVWMKLNLAEHPLRLRGAEPGEDELSLEMQFWTQLAEGGVLAAPGWFFSAYVNEDGSGPDFDREGHLRISFSNASTEEMRKGIKIFEKTLREFFAV